MKWLIIFLVALTLVGCQATRPSESGTINWEQAGPDAQAQEISFDQVKEAVSQGAVFYDVRSPKEFQNGNFGITENFPVTDMEAGKLPDLPMDTPIYVHCQSGRRSADAAKLLRETGFTKVYDLGGLAAVEAIGGVLGQ